MCQGRRLTAVLATIAAGLLAACTTPSNPRDREVAASPPQPAMPTASPGTQGSAERGKAALGEASKPRRSATSGSQTAAARYGWTNLVARDDFAGSALHPSWGAYDSKGNSGKGVRSPRQISLRDGVLRMTGTPDGTTAGMAWRHPQKYGRWEIRARFPAGCGCYHPVLILWPDADPWPAGGEIDYAEVFDSSRQNLNFFLHYGADNRQLRGDKRVDMTRWHSFAVEWTSDHLTGYVDGEAFFHTSQRNALPPGPMNQTIQLDWFPGPRAAGAVLEVDWATIYRL